MKLQIRLEYPILLFALDSDTITETLRIFVQSARMARGTYAPGPTSITWAGAHNHLTHLNIDLLLALTTWVGFLQSSSVYILLTTLKC